MARRAPCPSNCRYQRFRAGGRNSSYGQTASLRWLLTLGYVLLSLPTAVLLIGPGSLDRSFWAPTENSFKQTMLSSLRGFLRPGIFLATQTLTTWPARGTPGAFTALLIEHPW